ncbi:Aldo/keto reductase [Hymenopellis radicata]|nr:Aldo/keto reductase [Hymenopellis radicata]
MSVFTTPPPLPKTKLGFYRLLSPLAGIRVSPIQLGAMSIGDKWAQYGFGSMDKESSFKLLDAYHAMGGNFIDTANNYQDESSEKTLGEWMEARGVRDQIVLATKYSMNFHRGNEDIAQKINYTGNGTKSLHLSIRASLQKLRTDYIDILYVHWWDFETSIEEVMNSLHNLVVQGKVLYLGISDTPAWIVSQANYYAKLHGKTPFSIYQGRWNVLDRSFEREIIPMARSLGLALAPFDVLCGGKIRTDAEEQARRESGDKGRVHLSSDWERTPTEKKMTDALEKVAAEHRTTNMRAIAIAYVMQKTPYVFPIIGGRKVEQLQSNLEALDITLTPEQYQAIDSVIPFDPGFPTTLIGDGRGHNIFLTTTAHLSKMAVAAPILPSTT